MKADVLNKKADVKKEITKAWNNANSADMFERKAFEIYIVQQFFTWGEFKALVNKLTGYKF